MGFCASKEDAYGRVYLEMLRRLSVTPTRVENAAASEKRSSEFKRVLSMKGQIVGETNGEKCAAVEQLKMYDREKWKLSSVYPYNEQLLVDTAEDIYCLKNHHYLHSDGDNNTDSIMDSRVMLRWCDYRPWQLYMCEFYHVMSVFEKSKLSGGGKWEKTNITPKKLEKCLKTLTTEFKSAFAWSGGPGAAFRPPSSAPVNAVLEEVSKWSRNSLRGGERGGRALDQGAPLVTLARWVALRYVMSVCGEYELQDEEESGEGAGGISSSKHKGNISYGASSSSPGEILGWNEMYPQKILFLKRLLEDPSELESLYDVMTHGTKILSEKDAEIGVYEHLAMDELLENRGFHDTLVQVAFRAVMREFGDGSSCIDNDVPLFATFLQAYVAVLELYNEAITHEGMSSGSGPMYGQPVSDLDREALRNVLDAMCRRDSDKKDDYVDQLFSFFFAGEEDTGQIPFLGIADLWVGRLIRGTNKDGLKSISDLYYALGLGNAEKRKWIFSFLSAKGWDASNSERTFNALKEMLDLPGYCNSKELACACASDQWISQWEEWGKLNALGGHGNEDEKNGMSLHYNRDKNYSSGDIHLRCLLHGVYGTIVAVRALENTSLEEDRSDNLLLDFAGAPKWKAETIVPFELCSDVLRQVSDSLGLKKLGEDVMKTNENEENDINATKKGNYTALSLVQYISSHYVNEQLLRWGREAWKRLLSEWLIMENKRDSDEGDNGNRQCAFCDTILGKEGEFSLDTEEGMEELIYYFRDKLYEQYASDILLIMPRDEFYTLFRAGVDAVRECTNLDFNAENLHMFLRYILGYMNVLISFGVSHNDSVRNAPDIRRKELQEWVLQETGIVVEDDLSSAFKKSLDPRGGDNVSLQDLADWFALREALWSSADSRLDIWMNKLRGKLPAGNTVEDMRKRKQIGNEISMKDNYISIEAIEELFSKQHELWRVWPAEFGNTFLSFATRETNIILQRENLQGKELHRTNLQFLMNFIRTYLDAFLHVDCVVEKATATAEDTHVGLGSEMHSNKNNINTNEESKSLATSFRVPLSDCYDSDEMHACLHLLVKDRGLDEESILKEIANRGMALPCTTAYVARTVARASTAAAFNRYYEKKMGRNPKNSMWERLRQRLPSGDSLEERLKRQYLFDIMDVRKVKFLTPCDLYRGMVDLLTLQEFRDDLQPILYRAFYATKEVTLSDQNCVYLTSGNEHFITGKEFRAFLWYMYAYFQMYYMFDALCMKTPHPLKKEVTLEAFVRSEQLLRKWGLCAGDVAGEFASIEARCEGGGAMYFTGFAIWASKHHLTPVRYSHEEITDEDEEETEVGVGTPVQDENMINTKVNDEKKNEEENGITVELIV